MYPIRPKNVHMFDLEFHKIAKKILDWSDAPGSMYNNTHESLMAKRTNGSCYKTALKNLKAMPSKSKQLHEYVASSYPHYFLSAFIFPTQ